MTTARDAFSLNIRLAADSGQLLALADSATGRTILSYAPGAELCWNDVPLETRLAAVETSRDEHLTLLRAELPTGYGAGASLHIRRVISRGSTGLRPGTPDSVHIRYEVTRVPNTPHTGGLDYIWQPPLEAPLRLDALTVLHAPTAWFGPKTHLRALALGGTGPREHVSIEDGPVADVVPWLQSGFRTEFPGQQTVGGGLYYHPESEAWIWMLARRPTTTGRVLFGARRHAYRFGYHLEMTLGREVFTPAVSVFWGKGMDEADRTLAAQFDLYEEPPDWMWRTVWFWLHPIWTRGVDFTGALDGAKCLMETCGVNGFGLTVHDVPPAGHDIDVASPAPSPLLGGHPGLKRLVAGLRAGGAHSYVWISRHGHRPDSTRFGDSWAIRGADGRPIRIRNRPGAGVNLDILNCADPGFQSYIREWIRYYVADLGIDGLFWDSGFQPLPPDFGGKPYLRWPGETNALAPQFYADILRYGQRLNPDFFMWAEGISVDVPMNGFSVDAKRHGEHSGNRFMQRLAHLGPHRLLWRSAWPHDLASGFVMLNPANDIGRDKAFYKEIAADPMNQWVCRTVRERGVRHAVGLGDGVSLLDEFVVTRPGYTGVVRVPAAHCRGRTLRHVVSGAAVRGRAREGDVCFQIETPGAYTFD
jgi:hypothetical protein